MFRVAALLVVAVAAAGCTNPQAKANRLIAAGDAYAEQGRFNAAIIEYRNALKQVPDSSVAYLQMGRAYVAAGDHRSAYEALTRAVDLNPTDLRPRLEAGELLFKAGVFDAAQVRADQVLASDPENVAAQILAGRSLAAQRRLDEGLALLHLAAGKSRGGRAWTAIGDVKRQAGDDAGAEAAYREAIARDPEAIEPRASFAAFLIDAGRIDEAEAQLIDAAKTAPDDELANRALASLYLATERQDEAETYLKRAAERPIQKYRSALALSDYYASLGRFDAAKAALARVLRAETTDAAAAQVRLAAIAYASGSPEEGRKLLDRALRRHPTPEALALERQIQASDFTLQN
jgi:tetratricopeptide (TPR) repeat protein